MEHLLFYLAIATLLFFVGFGIDLVVGNRSIRILTDVPSTGDAAGPRVSIIIPARNEERNIREALQSVLNQDYRDIEVLVIDDRSTDGTGAILDRMAQGDARLRVVRVTELPPGWLGKNHALHCGAQQATGDLILFADADIVMHPATVRKAVGYLVANRLDHLTITPEVRMPGVLLDVFVGAFTVFFSLYARPWKARDPRSTRFIGIGGFNLVRAPVYRAVGTHRAIAMRPDDDMKLGKLIKWGGYRQEVLFGRDMLQVEWYPSLRALIEGLMKNAFAGVNYSILAIVAASIAQFLLNVWPFLGLFLTHGATRNLNAVIVLLILLVCWDNARFHNARWWYGIGFPVSTLLFIYILWRSMLLAFRNDGIRWRGTHYPLADLRANKV
jgi:glycosyltransferase involved in cell wall biosynthesis